MPSSLIRDNLGNLGVIKNFVIVHYNDTAQVHPYFKDDCILPVATFN
jgi:hypothetical protein